MMFSFLLLHETCRSCNGGLCPAEMLNRRSTLALDEVPFLQQPDRMEKTDYMRGGCVHTHIVVRVQDPGDVLG